MSFSGIAVFPEQTVELEYQRTDGTFATFASTRAETTPLVLSDGTQFYRWEVAAVVPRWQAIMVGCHAIVQAVGVSGTERTPLMSFDERGAKCVSDELAEGTPFQEAIDTCAAQEYTSFQLRANDQTLQGDFLVTSQAEAEAGALACATVIDGDVTVRAAAGAVVQMAHLEQVTGDLVIEVEGSGATMGRVSLPSLHGVAGTLRFHHKTTGYNDTVDLGLNGLWSLAGNLELILDSFNGSYTGPVVLQSVGGNVSIRARGDFYAPNLLRSLKTIGGDLSVTTNAGSSANVLVGLETVGGSVTLDGLDIIGGGNVLDALQSVGGDLTVEETAWFGPGFASLASVAGTLHVDSSGTAFGGLPGNRLGSASLSIGALELVTTQFKSVPFVAATVGITGNITITNNPYLCQASVDTFVAAQQQAGWSGTLTTSANTGTCN